MTSGYWFQQLWVLEKHRSRRYLEMELIQSNHSLWLPSKIGASNTFDNLPPMTATVRTSAPVGAIFETTAAVAEAWFTRYEEANSANFGREICLLELDKEVPNKLGEIPRGNWHLASLCRYEHLHCRSKMISAVTYQFHLSQVFRTKMEFHRSPHSSARAVVLSEYLSRCRQWWTTSFNIPTRTTSAKFLSESGEYELRGQVKLY